MNGIFYFSSTGNSLYIAEQIKAELGGEIRYIPKFTGDVNAYDKIIIVSPIHSYGLPTLVYNFIANMKSAKPLYIVLNCGGLQSMPHTLLINFAKTLGSTFVPFRLS